MGTEHLFYRDDDRQQEYEKERVSEKRNSLRIPMNIPARFYRQEDKDYQNPEECILVDISVGGACADSKYRYKKNEVLCLQVELENVQPIFLMGQVIRIDETESGVYRYGVLFAQVWDDELLRLNRVLENIHACLKEDTADKRLARKRIWQR